LGEVEWVTDLRHGAASLSLDPLDPENLMVDVDVTEYAATDSNPESAG
jgi:hypothetical protein